MEKELTKEGFERLLTKAAQPIPKKPAPEAEQYSCGIIKVTLAHRGCCFSGYHITRPSPTSDASGPRHPPAAKTVAWD